MSPTATPNGRSSRVFSESDEIQILKCLIRDTKSISPPITTVGTPTINCIIKHLNDKFSPTQINDKLRRLRACKKQIPGKNPPRPKNIQDFQKNLGQEDNTQKEEE
ncbi:hypothetical protein HRI_003124900 [Hibiscus trionum]|uniref:Glabrous enhancer-binding protein-like DBD domain-containing protein n=1 Tax=Hibiscus trionum TaxID=183268 RepID=A0A9W7IDX2_HIBTR|nr:hypothetical protein HRI_003124900 [Hibiscus trionum]